MRLIVLSLAILLAATSIAAAAPSLAAQEGRWVCLPDDQTAPQVLVDFEENVYRRCDQNTCTNYDILTVQRDAKTTEISFAPGAIMRAATFAMRRSTASVWVLLIRSSPFPAGS